MLYPHWLNPGDNSWQLTAATLVGLMSIPGLVVLYGGVMQKRWSVNSMMLAFITFALIERGCLDALIEAVRSIHGRSRCGLSAIRFTFNRG